jgi:DNA-binding transcriptional MerR regulator
MSFFGTMPTAPPITKSLPTKNIDSAALTAILADIFDVIDLQPSSDVQHLLRDVLHIARDERLEAVPVASAAEILEVSQPTIRSWIDRGVLEVRTGRRPVKVTSESLGRALATVRRLRSAGATKGLLEKAVNDLRDREDRLALVDRIEELRQETTVPIDLDNLDELFQ